jgi:chitinase
MLKKLITLERNWKCAILAAFFTTLFSSALSAAEWNSTTTYATPGAIVEYNGQTYKNYWWTQGDNPDGFTDNPWHVWRPVDDIIPEPEPEPTPIPDPVHGDIESWDSGTIYYGGDQVVFNGQLYKAFWWTQGDNPDEFANNPWHVWRPIEGVVPGPDPEPEPQPDPIPEPEPQPTPVPNPANLNKKINGYFAEWSIYDRNYQVTDIPVEYITHINYAFFDVKNGIPVVYDTWAALEKRFPEVVTEYGTFPVGDWNGEKEYYGNFERLNRLDELVNEYYNKDIVIMVSVGGWNSSWDFPNVVATYESRQKFINELVRLIEKYKFEGVCYDWEFPVIGAQFSYDEPKLEESAQFISLVKETRTAFNDLAVKTGIDYEITVSFNLAEKNIKDVDIKSISDYADNLDIMTYDISAVAWGNAAGHQSPIYHNPANPDSFNDPTFKQGTVNASVQYLISQGVPREKIMIGSPLYGRTGSGIQYLFQQGGTIGGGTWENGAYDYDSIVGKSSKINLPTDPSFYYWDDIAQASYYINSDGEFVSYDNLQAIQEKCKYIKEQDLGGWFIWEFSCNRDAELIEAAHNSLITNL